MRKYVLRWHTELLPMYLLGTMVKWQRGKKVTKGLNHWTHKVRGRSSACRRWSRASSLASCCAATSPSWHRTATSEPSRYSSDRWCYHWTRYINYHVQNCRLWVDSESYGLVFCAVLLSVSWLVIIRKHENFISCHLLTSYMWAYNTCSAWVHGANAGRTFSSALNIVT